MIDQDPGLARQCHDPLVLVRIFVCGIYQRLADHVCGLDRAGHQRQSAAVSQRADVS